MTRRKHRPNGPLPFANFPTFGIEPGSCERAGWSQSCWWANPSWGSQVLLGRHFVFYTVSLCRQKCRSPRVVKPRKTMHLAETQGRNQLVSFTRPVPCQYSALESMPILYYYWILLSSWQKCSSRGSLAESFESVVKALSYFRTFWLPELLGVLTSRIRSFVSVRFGACECCCCQMSVGVWFFGAWVLVLLQGAPTKTSCSLSSRILDTRKLLRVHCKLRIRNLQNS